MIELIFENEPRDAARLRDRHAAERLEMEGPSTSRFSIAMMAASGIEARGFVLGGHGEKHILRAADQCALFSELSRAQELSLP
jgi:hypothetical protein